MVRLETIEDFTLEAFDELKNIERKAGGIKGKLNVGDTFECSEAMAKYLMGENKLNKVVAKVIEVKPEKETEPVKEVQEIVEDNKVVEAPKKKKNKRAK